MEVNDSESCTLDFSFWFRIILITLAKKKMPRQDKFISSQKAIQGFQCYLSVEALFHAVCPSGALTDEHSDELSEDIMVVSSQWAAVGKDLGIFSLSIPGNSYLLTGWTWKKQFYTVTWTHNNAREDKKYYLILYPE